MPISAVRSQARRRSAGNASRLDDARKQKHTTIRASHESAFENKTPGAAVERTCCDTGAIQRKQSLVSLLATRGCLVSAVSVQNTTRIERANRKRAIVGPARHEPRRRRRAIQFIVFVSRGVRAHNFLSPNEVDFNRQRFGNSRSRCLI